MFKTTFRVLRGYSAIGMIVLGLGVESVAESPRTAPSVAIQSNSNQTAAGRLEDGVLTLHLELRQGDWYPEAETGPSMKVYAFAEEGGPLQVPGPLSSSTAFSSPGCRRACAPLASSSRPRGSARS